MALMHLLRSSIAYFHNRIRVWPHRQLYRAFYPTKRCFFYVFLKRCLHVRIRVSVGVCVLNPFWISWVHGNLSDFIWFYVTFMAIIATVYMGTVKTQTRVQTDRVRVTVLKCLSNTMATDTEFGVTEVPYVCWFWWCYCNIIKHEKPRGATEAPRN